MAVGLRMEFEGMGLSEYDAVCKALDFPGDWPDGLIAHGSAEADGGLVVADVWESREKFDSFVAGRLGAAIGQAVGPDAPRPEITETALHTFYARST